MQDKNQTHALLIDCPDQPGLIHKVSGVLYSHKFNILSNREFVDEEKGHFFMRTAFQGKLGTRQDLVKEISSVLPDKARVEIPKNKKKTLIILASHEHHCLAELLIRNSYNELNAEIKAVTSNHNVLEKLVKKFDLPFHEINNDQGQNEQEEEALSVFEKYQADYLVLAKYMKILSPEFVQKYKNRIINIHHSFLPAFVGANPYRQAYERGVKIIGATAHFVTRDLDQGPIILQDVANIDHTYSVEVMQQAGRDIEKITLVKALDLVCDDRVILNGNKTIVFK